VVIAQPGKRILLIHIRTHDRVFLFGHHGRGLFGRWRVGLLLLLLRAAQSDDEHGRHYEDTCRAWFISASFFLSLYTRSVDCVATEFAVQPALETEVRADNGGR